MANYDIEVEVMRRRKHVTFKILREQNLLTYKYAKGHRYDVKLNFIPFVNINKIF